MNVPHVRRAPWIAALLLAALSWPGPASALSIDPAEMLFQDRRSPGMMGVLEVVGIELGPQSGAIVLDGSVGPSDTLVLFRTSITEDSPGLGRLILSFRRPTVSEPLFGDPLPPSAAGWLSGSHADVELIGLFNSATFGFPTLAQDALHTSDIFFLAFPTLQPGDRIFVGAQIDPALPPAELVRHAGTVVPEPASGALLGFALLALAWLQSSARIGSVSK